MSEKQEHEERLLEQAKQVLIERAIQQWRQSEDFQKLFHEAGKKRIIELYRQRAWLEKE